MKGERVKVRIDGHTRNAEIIETVPEIWGGDLYVVYVQSLKTEITVKEESIIRPQ